MCLVIAALAGNPPLLARAGSQARSRFQFRNGFWINLHHALLGDARRLAGGLQPAVAVDAFEPDERTAWTAALGAYAAFNGRSVIFDDALVHLNNILTDVPDDDAPARLEAATSTTLARAAAVYRRRVWPDQRQMNADWIAAISPIVNEHAVVITSAIAAAYRTMWPSEPVIVDVTSDADIHGGYTTAGPPGTAAHTTIASSVEANQGDMAVEIIFHEASHGIDDRIMKLVGDECARQHVAVPRDLWHALLFYTAGEIVRRELGKAGDAAYETYADRFGVYDRGWRTFRTALERDWLPYLEGKQSFDHALAALIHDSTRSLAR